MRENVRELYDRSIAMSQIETEEKDNLNIEYFGQEIQDNIKSSKICIIRIPGEEKNIWRNKWIWCNCVIKDGADMKCLQVTYILEIMWRKKAVRDMGKK